MTSRVVRSPGHNSPACGGKIVLPCQYRPGGQDVASDQALRTSLDCTRLYFGSCAANHPSPTNREEAQMSRQTVQQARICGGISGSSINDFLTASLTLFWNGARGGGRR
jgi:hypothetical protein